MWTAGGRQAWADSIEPRSTGRLDADAAGLDTGNSRSGCIAHCTRPQPPWLNQWNSSSPSTCILTQPLRPRLCRTSRPSSGFPPLSSPHPVPSDRAHGGARKDELDCTGRADRGGRQGAQMGAGMSGQVGARRNGGTGRQQARLSERFGKLESE